MANQCSICHKQLKSKAALKDQTDTANQKLRKAHVCRKCDRPFCSQKAMEAHRDSPDHITFSCHVCNKSFGSKQAIKAHQKSLRHTSAVQRAEEERAHQTLIGATISAGNASSTSTVPHTPAAPSNSALHHTDDSSTTDEEDWKDEGAWIYDPDVGQDDDQDWGLCDRDCGWCGHCADGMDY